MGDMAASYHLAVFNIGRAAGPLDSHQMHDFLRRRREFFQHMAEAFLVLWWIPAGHIPTLDEAIAKLDEIRRNGPAPGAFTFREPFDPPVDSGVVISYRGRD